MRISDWSSDVCSSDLFKPDKNSIEYKALDAACSEMQIAPARLMLNVGGVASARDLHFSRFLFECFPRGIAFPTVAIPILPALPVADVSAFSIDDVTTTEIDDAMSVKRLAAGRVQVGVDRKSTR